ncbi:MAG TPA: hypothetical protein VL463_08345 [Kofleriaceae bacterium]|jgi:hypothetical protein|nr:hypothetical protein [Kofleriaceae bacterium]
MGFFDDVSSFFGMGEKKDEGPISVPLGYDEKTAANDPAVKAAQAKYSAAEQHEEELKQQEITMKQQAEAAQFEDWMKKSNAAQADYEALKTKYEASRTKAQGGDLYEDEKQAMYQKLTGLYQKAETLKNRAAFNAQNPLDKYMDQKFVAQLKQAGLARMQAYAELDAAKRATGRAR